MAQLQTFESPTETLSTVVLTWMLSTSIRAGTHQCEIAATPQYTKET